MTAPFLPEYITARNSSFHSPSPSLSALVLSSSKVKGFIPPCFPPTLYTTQFPLHLQLSPAFRLISPQRTFCPPCVHTHLACPSLWWHLLHLHKDVVANRALEKNQKEFSIQYVWSWWSYTSISTAISTNVMEYFCLLFCFKVITGNYDDNHRPMEKWN